MTAGVFPLEKRQICMLALSHLATIGRSPDFFLFFCLDFLTSSLFVFASAFPACLSTWLAGGNAPVHCWFNLVSPHDLELSGLWPVVTVVAANQWTYKANGSCCFCDDSPTFTCLFYPMELGQEKSFLLIVFASDNSLKTFHILCQIQIKPTC
ncbi:hypothetical protein CHARACLAT_016474 [Characodon lateralis]|uniref:Uncharacterized protein n=1 Tax=Characodon lateralis TaxID=208331 RepID=A0ABU7CNR8_9TELE|nr:hypothetical protein [Characodon lateralis]